MSNEVLDTLARGKYSPGIGGAKGAYMHTTNEIRRLERQRRLLGLTYIEVARTTGIRREKVSDILRGPSNAEVAMITDALNAYDAK